MKNYSHSKADISCFLGGKMKNYLTIIGLLLIHLSWLPGQESTQRIHIVQAVYGQQFQTYLDRIYSLPEDQRQVVADSFMAAVPAVPFTEQDTFAYFIYKGTADKMAVPGDANGWDPEAFPMTQITGTDFWYAAQLLEPDARLDYKFVKNGSTWLLDPLNPNKVTGGFGDNSELAMPGYIQPPEIKYYPDIAHGAIKDTMFESIILENTRKIRVYTPPGYDQAVMDSFPLILFHDGLEYISLASAANVLDYLIAEKRIRPVIAVFVPPVGRDNEYAGGVVNDFILFIVDEVVYFIDRHYRALRDGAYWAMAGPSLAGLVSTQICYEYPEIFGLCAPYSPSYWANGRQVYNTVIDGPVKEIKFYLDWGSYETTIKNDAVDMRDHLIEKGYDLRWNEWHEGHSWGSWRAHIDNALEYFFPWDSTLGANGDNQAVTGYALLQNYPNPFNPNTVISYQVGANDYSSVQVDLSIYNLLGQKVAILVDEKQKSGYHKVIWDAGRFASGIYFYKIIAGDFMQVKRMLLLR